MLRNASWIARHLLVAMAFLAVACSDDHVTGEFRPTHHAGIEGRVTDSAGDPLPGVRLSALSEKSGIAYANTKADGNYQLVFLPYMGDTIDRPDDTVSVTVYAFPATGLHRDSVLGMHPALLTFHPVAAPIAYVHLDLVALPLP